MISSLLKRIMKSESLKQRDLAELLCVSLDRIKSLTSGKAKKLTREEGEALIKKLNIRAEWLATGEGPMFQSVSEQELHRRITEVSEATRKANLEALTEDKRLVLQEILFSVEVGDVDALSRLLQPQVSDDEKELLTLFRAAPLAVKGAVLGALTATGQPQSQPYNHQGDGSLSISGDNNRVVGGRIIKNK